MQLPLWTSGFPKGTNFFKSSPLQRDERQILKRHSSPSKIYQPSSSASCQMSRALHFGEAALLNLQNLFERLFKVTKNQNYTCTFTHTQRERKKSVADTFPDYFSGSGGIWCKVLVLHSWPCVRCCYVYDRNSRSESKFSFIKMPPSNQTCKATKASGLGSSIFTQLLNYFGIF